MEEIENFIIPFDNKKHKLESIDQLTEDNKKTFKNKTYKTVILKAGMHLHRLDL